MLIRLRTPLGVWRIKDLNKHSTIEEVMQIASLEHSVTFDGDLALNPDFSNVLRPSRTLGSLGIEHGDMIYGRLDEEESKKAGDASQTKRVIGSDGTIFTQEYEESAKDQGFRPGMMSLKSMKMQWTLNEFCEMDDQFNFKIRGQESAFCTAVSLDISSLNSFQAYMRNFDFNTMRVGFLYGHFCDNNEVMVEAIYEPPQETTQDSFLILEDDWEERVECVASLLEMTRVGWIFSHPPREEGFHLSGLEVITAAVMQLECGEGVTETPFVTVSCTKNPDGEAIFEGYQVSKLCMEMVAEEALEVSEKELGMVGVNETFTAILEGNEASDIDTNMFLNNVPIKQHNSTLLTSSFPKANREYEVQDKAQMKQHLNKSGSEGWTVIDLLSDFNCLLFLCDHLDIASDIPQICFSVLDREENPLDMGFKLILAAIFEIDKPLV